MAKKTVKILHIIPTLSPSAGGPTEVAINLVRELNKLGAQAEILTTNDNGNELFDVPFGVKTDFRDVPVWFLPRSKYRLKEFIPSPKAVSWLKQNINHYDILDIHYLFSYLPLFSRQYARKIKFPYTVRTMGQLSPWALQQSSLKKKVFFRWQEYANLKKANALHSTSLGEEEDIRAFGLVNIPFINLPLGVEKQKINPEAGKLLRQKYNIDQNDFILLFLSRLHHKKRPELFIDLIKELNKESKVHGIIAGSGTSEYENELKDQVRGLGLSEKITFTGFVEGDNKIELLQGSDLFVLPSYSENFAIAVAESLAGGTPVVITPEVQISEYVKEYNAGVIIPNNLINFKEAILDLINNPSKINELQFNATKLVDEKFNWVKIAKDLLKEYKNILVHSKFI